METKQVEIGATCHLTSTVYSGGSMDVYLDYIEHSADHWHSDTETSLDIDKDKAVEIINFLKDAFSI